MNVSFSHHLIEQRSGGSVEGIKRFIDKVKPGTRKWRATTWSLYEVEDALGFTQGLDEFLDRKVF